jgi:hypothetical protein
MAAVVLGLLGLTSAFLFAYGANVLYLSLRAARATPPPTHPPISDPPPHVLVQLPVYNERYVATRVLDAACSLDWPRRRLTVQVLDDSDDETTELIATAAARWRARGIDVRHVRRHGREGYKAGALAHGLTLSRAPFVAVFDADFVPPRDFLRRALPAFSAPRVGFVQARWGHLNRTHSLFTRLQALMTDFHFLVEQAMRPRLGFPTNFTGSAGVWRRAAIEDAGGWSAATLTEDLDLSYRAQLRGWRGEYLEDLVVPQELCVAVNAYRAQQSRWATGSFQCVRRLLWPLLCSPLPRAARFQGAMHLLGYGAPLAMLAQVACYPVLVAGDLGRETFPWWMAASLISLAPAVGMSIAQARAGRSWLRSLPLCLAWSVLGAGTALTVAVALGRALRGGGGFERTPKFAIDERGEDWRSKRYVRRRDRLAPAELAAAAVALGLALAAVSSHRWVMAGYALLFALGFLAMGLGGLLQALPDRRRPAQAALALGSCGLVLLAFTRLPEPFEDGYQHWLIAANLATTGRLADPLFQMQDTWLPAYQVLAALVLKLVGIWRLDALELMSAALGVVTLLFTYRLAGGHRPGVIAVLLLTLNPAFLLTSTSAVAEPLLVAALTGAALAAARGRPGWATAAACLAALTGTKAWIWLGLAAGLVTLEALRRHRRWWRVAWPAPALALALSLEVGFGFASHSVARATVEVTSAVARGSLAAPPAARAGQFLGYLALASLPAAALAPIGLARAWRGRDPLLRLLYLPSLGYLAVVVGLLWNGDYSGSQRYYLPLLPALALLAARALEPGWRPARAALAAGAVGAAAAVTALYVPVLQGLAADNRGLVAAGRAAAALPGALLTDSPTAAYWSHKPPAEIHGSRELPEGRASALDWLRRRGVGALVLEDVDYYRAVRVLPGEADGRPAPPFLPIGDERAYTVPGGKRVLVYGLDVAAAPLAEGVWARSDDAHGRDRGKTAPLGRGAYLARDGSGLAGGGLGFGLPVLQAPDGWWFPATAGPPRAVAGGWEQEFDLSLREVDDARGQFLRFQPGPDQGRAIVTYRPTPGRLHVHLRIEGLSPEVRRVVVLNEESAAFDDAADARQTLRGSRIGSWTPVSGSWARLRSDRLGVEWEIDRPASASEFVAARERRPASGIDFSGLEMVFGPAFTGVEYDVRVRRS